MLSNAIKFTPAGGRIAIRSADDEPGRVRFEFEDNGIGIASDSLPKLFRPFEQGDRLVTRRFGGLGLGLSISLTLAELHGGTLEARSDGPGRGATFVLRLPVRSETTGEEPAPEAAAAAVPSSGLRILLVEDNAATAAVMRRMLDGRLHHRVVAVASSFADAVAKLAEIDSGQIDVVLCDLGLPDGDGLDLVGHIRARHPGARPIALTGYGTEDDIRRTAEAGFVAHLTKPVRLAQLEGVLAVAPLSSVG